MLYLSAYLGFETIMQSYKFYSLITLIIFGTLLLKIIPRVFRNLPKIFISQVARRIVQTCVSQQIIKTIKNELSIVAVICIL